jgi:hypothetical protein
MSGPSYKRFLYAALMSVECEPHAVGLVPFGADVVERLAGLVLELLLQSCADRGERGSEGVERDLQGMRGGGHPRVVGVPDRLEAHALHER